MCRTITADHIKEWWFEGKFGDPAYFRCVHTTDLDTEFQLILDPAGLEDPSTKIVVMWRGPTIDGDLPIQAIIIYLNGLYLAGTRVISLDNANIDIIDIVDLS